MPKVEIDEKELSEMKQSIADSIANATTLSESIAKLEANNQALLKEKTDAKTTAQLAIEEAAKKSGDVDALEKSWQSKLDIETGALKDQLSVSQSVISKMTSGSAAQSMANELALQGSADVLLPHIQSRLKTEINDGKAITRVLDKDGKPSAMSLDDLKTEFGAMKAFAPILIGSKASGSGDGGVKQTNSSVSTMKHDDFNALPLNEQTALGSKIAKGDLVLGD